MTKGGKIRDNNIRCAPPFSDTCSYIHSACTGRKRSGGTTNEKIYAKMTTTLAIIFFITTVALVILAAA